MYNILIGGDIVPTKSNNLYFEKGDIKMLFGQDILNIMNDTNYCIYNLECPFSNVTRPINKSGPALVANLSAINAIRSIKPSLVTLANNHIMDQGEEGLFSTIKLLNESNINFIGAGKDICSAQKPYFIETNKKRVGFFACAEHEFSIATADKPGANPVDLLDTPDLVYNIKKECDYLIILYHGGKEYYRYPSPQLQRRCRKLSEKGANLIVCQHSHCIGCMEKFGDSTIVYGQGNFIFDGSDEECWRTSLLIVLDDNFDISFVPIVKEKNVVRLAKGEKANLILSDFECRNNEIKENGIIEEKFDEISSKEIDTYLLKMSGFRTSFAYYVLNKLFFHKLTPYLIKRRYAGESLLSIKNYIECEAHSELILNGLNKKIELYFENKK